MIEKLCSDVIKNLVLANADDEMRAIAAVSINHKGEAELQIGMPNNQAYNILAALEILKYNIIRQILTEAGKPLKDRE